MAQLRKKLIAALKRELPDVQDALDDLPGGRVSGVVISAGFGRSSHRARQARLKQILERDLTAAELEKIGPIAALTPSEATVRAS